MRIEKHDVASSIKGKASGIGKTLGAIILVFSTIVSFFAIVQAQPPHEVVTRDTVRACELPDIDDMSTLEEVLDALKTEFGNVLDFPQNPARALLQRIEVVRSSTCVVTEWEFYFLGDPTNPNDIPFEVIPFGRGNAQHDVTLYNPGCGCEQ